MMKISLPFWFDAAEITALKDALVNYWDAVESWLTWPATQIDPLTCKEAVLNLIAYQRDMTRLPGEPLTLYRKRVKYAYLNAQDAGSVAGFARIFERLGIGYIELEERTDPVDWDVITLYVSDSTIAANAALLGHIIRQYGRTCRRYTFAVLTGLEVTMPAFAVGHSYHYDVAEL